MWVNESKSVTALQISERHCFQQGRFSGPCFSNNVDVCEAVLVLDSEESIVVTKIDASKMCNVVRAHLSQFSPGPPVIWGRQKIVKNARVRRPLSKSKPRKR